MLTEPPQLEIRHQPIEVQAARIKDWFIRNGHDMVVPPRYKAKEMAKAWNVEKLEPNEHSDLAVETSALRNSLINEVTKSVRENKPFAVIHRDSDRLKQANDDIGHWFGNISIRRSACELTNILEKIMIEKEIQLKAAVFVPSKSTDEVTAAIFGDEKDINILLSEFAKYEEKPIRVPGYDYDFSSTTSYIKSTDEKLSDLLKDTQERLAKEGDIDQAKSLWYEAVDIAQRNAHEAKDQKILKKIPHLVDLMRMERGQFDNIIGKVFNGTRPDTKVGGMKKMLDVLHSKFFGSDSPIYRKWNVELINGGLEKLEEIYERVFPKENIPVTNNV